jgi:ferredoxin-NADP reductase
MRVPDRLTGLTRAVARTAPRLLTTFTTPLIPDDYAGLFDPLRGREIRGRIVSVDHHPDFTTLTIEPGPGLPNRFEAGQFIGLGLQIDGVWRWRCYSLTNPPTPSLSRGTSGHTRRELTVSVRPVPDGRVSTRLADHARPGGIIRLTAPGGDFHLPSPVPGKLLFITAGAGITPVMSMLRWLRQESGDATPWPDVVHLHSERGPEPARPFGRELGELAGKVPSYHLIHRDTTTAGRLTPDDVTALVPDHADRVAFACGPEQFLDALRGLLPDLRTESFHTADTVAVDAADLGGEIILGSSGVTASSTGTTTILEAAEDAGVPLVHGCRMGICRTCVTPVVDGTAVDLRDGTSYGPGEQIRTCCCVPAGTLHLDTH